jgi:hypothetical protein
MSGDGISVPGYKLQGIDVETSWDAGTGSIYLGADKTKEPLGTLTMGGVVKSSNGTWYVNLATLSKSDVRVGTAEVLHARSYSAEEVTGVLSVRLSNVVVGANFIRAEIRGTFDRVLLHPEDLPERVYVAGSFTAMHN